MEDFNLSESVLNVKILQNLYTKNLRFITYDPEQGIANLEKVMKLSTFLCSGCPPTLKLKHYQINFEIGKAFSASLN